MKDWKGLETKVATERSARLVLCLLLLAGCDGGALGPTGEDEGAWRGTGPAPVDEPSDVGPIEGRAPKPAPPQAGEGDVFVDEPALAEPAAGDATVLHVHTRPGKEAWVLAAARALLGGKAQDAPARVRAAQALAADVAAAQVTVTATVTEVGPPQNPDGGPDEIVAVTFAPDGVVAGKGPVGPWTSRYQAGGSCTLPVPAEGSRWLVFLSPDVGGLDLTVGVPPRRLEGDELALLPGAWSVSAGELAAAAHAADQEVGP